MTNTRYTSVSARAHPGVIDAREAGLGLVEDEEGGEVGGVRGHDDHGEAGPHHPEHPGGETSRRALANSWRNILLFGGMDDDGHNISLLSSFPF